MLKSGPSAGFAERGDALWAEECDQGVKTGRDGMA